MLLEALFPKIFLEKLQRDNGIAAVPGNNEENREESRDLTKSWGTGQGEGRLLHDGRQRGRELVTLELQFDEFHSYGKLQGIHPPIIVHVS